MIDETALMSMCDRCSLRPASMPCSCMRGTSDAQQNAASRTSRQGATLMGKASQSDQVHEPLSGDAQRVRHGSPSVWP